MRRAELTRETRETRVYIKLNLDGQGNVKINTGIPFFDHMLSAFAFHAGLDVEINAVGDLQIDAHHTVEDVGIVLGTVFAQALVEKAGIRRYGQSLVPMDESLVMTAIDCSGRSHLAWRADLLPYQAGYWQNCCAYIFWEAFVRKSNLTMHVRLMEGTDPHHQCEALFKSVGRAVGQAIQRTLKAQIPSTKGVL